MAVLSLSPSPSLPKHVSAACLLASPPAQPVPWSPFVSARLSLLSVSPSPCLTHWDMPLTGAQTLRGPAPPPYDLRPSPTALSSFSSFKRHINYSNEVRRDPAFAIRSWEHTARPPSARLPPAHPRQAGRDARWVQAPVPVNARQPHRIPPPPTPPPLCQCRVIGSLAKVNALLAGSSRG